MNSLSHTLKTYEESYDQLQKRIHKINAHLLNLNHTQTGLREELISRRTILYQEGWELQNSMRQMKSYLEATKSVSSERITVWMPFENPMSQERASLKK